MCSSSESEVSTGTEMWTDASVLLRRSLPSSANVCPWVKHRTSPYILCVCLTVSSPAVRKPWPASQIWPAAHFRVARMAVSTTTKINANFLNCQCSSTPSHWRVELLRLIPYYCSLDLFTSIYSFCSGIIKQCWNVHYVFPCKLWPA